MAARQSRERANGGDQKLDKRGPASGSEKHEVALSSSGDLIHELHWAHKTCGLWFCAQCARAREWHLEWYFSKHRPSLPQSRGGGGSLAGCNRFPLARTRQTQENNHGSRLSLEHSNQWNAQLEDARVVQWSAQARKVCPLGSPLMDRAFKELPLWGLCLRGIPRVGLPTCEMACLAALPPASQPARPRQSLWQHRHSPTTLLPIDYLLP